MGTVYGALLLDDAGTSHPAPIAEGPNLDDGIECSRSGLVADRNCSMLDVGIRLAALQGISVSKMTFTWGIRRMAVRCPLTGAVKHGCCQT
jgi:hypothetical protein